jgi:hypothetical protein
MVVCIVCLAADRNDSCRVHVDIIVGIKVPDTMHKLIGGRQSGIALVAMRVSPHLRVDAVR